MHVLPPCIQVGLGLPFDPMFEVEVPDTQGAEIHLAIPSVADAHARQADDVLHLTVMGRAVRLVAELCLPAEVERRPSCALPRGLRQSRAQA